VLPIALRSVSSGKSLGQRANEARAPDKEQTLSRSGGGTRGGRGRSRPSRSPVRPAKGGVRGADVVRNAGATRSESAKQERFRLRFCASGRHRQWKDDLRGFGTTVWSYSFYQAPLQPTYNGSPMRRIIIGIERGKPAVFMAYMVLQALRAIGGVENASRPHDGRLAARSSLKRDDADDFEAWRCRPPRRRSRCRRVERFVMTEGMLIIPCSMKRRARSPTRSTRNLLVRAADVCLKEKRRLVLVIRETRFISVTFVRSSGSPKSVPLFYRRSRPCTQTRRAWTRSSHTPVGKASISSEIANGFSKRWRPELTSRRAKRDVAQRDPRDCRFGIGRNQRAYRAPRFRRARLGLCDRQPAKCEAGQHIPAKERCRLSGSLRAAPKRSDEASQARERRRGLDRHPCRPRKTYLAQQPKYAARRERPARARLSRAASVDHGRPKPTVRRRRIVDGCGREHRRSDANHTLIFQSSLSGDPNPLVADPPCVTLPECIATLRVREYLMNYAQQELIR